MTGSSNWSVTILQTATSSSDIVKQAAEQGAPEGTGILVLEQTAGRGRRGAVWQSAVGGMYFSLLLRPDFPVREWFGLSFVAALAIREELAAILPQNTVSLKWPNDVLVGDARSYGKICGILSEASGETLIIGTGVNIAPVNTPANAKQPALAVQDFGANITPQELSKRYMANLGQRYSDYSQAGFAAVRDEWLKYAAHLGKPVSTQINGKTLFGLFDDLGQDGTMLLLDDDGGRHHISTGDVDLIGSL